MSFGFGGLNTNSKIKGNNNLQKDFILVNNFNKNFDYYLFLLEGFPQNEKDIDKIKSKIDEAGYKSYIIASATTSVYKDDEVSQKTEYIKSSQSGWKSLLNYQEKHVKAIMSFGIALYAINKGTDLLVDCFYDTKMNKPYYYLGHGFIGNYDTFIFPVDGIDKLYPKEWKKGQPTKPEDVTTNFRTRFFYEQLGNMLGPKELPDDMRDYKVVVAENADHTSEILKKCSNAKVLAWDTETSSLRWYLKDSKIGCFTISVDGETGYYISADFIFKSRLNRKLFCEMCYSCNTMVGANIKFDLHYLSKQMPEFDINKVKHIDDVGQLSHAINSDRTKGLKPLTFFYTPFGGYDDELDVYKKQLKITNYLKIPQSILSKYATIDAIVTYRIFFALTKHMQWIDENFPNEKPIDWTISKWYNDFMVPAYTKFFKMEHTGMCIDYDYLLSVRQRLLKRIPEVTKKLADIWGVPTTFKFNSTLELGKQIEKMGWPCVERSAAGNYATSDACIQEWKRQNQPGIKELIQLRELNSFLGTFIGMPSDTGNQEDATGWEQFVTYHPEDNSYRIHQSYLIMGTETFRCIGKDPNLQNVPVHSKLASEINRCITVPTAPHYRIEFESGEIIEGGELDTIKVWRDDKEVLVHLNEVTESDDYVIGSFVKYKNDREDCFPQETGKDFDDLMNKLYDYVPADHEKFYPKTN